MSKTAQDDLQHRCNVIEETYEFMLAYAAQGLAGDAASPSGGQLREYLRRTDDALTGLGEVFGTLVGDAGLEPADRYEAFIAMLERDARDAQSAVQLVLIQPSISSQMIDNLNASIHLRTLLTDVFLIDEILKQRIAGAAAKTK